MLGMGKITNEVKKSSYLGDILKALSNVRTEYMVYCSPGFKKGNKSYYKYTEQCLHMNFIISIGVLCKERKRNMLVCI